MGCDKSFGDQDRFEFTDLPDGYPEWAGPPPEGPFTYLLDEEYKKSRKSANKRNRQVRNRGNMFSNAEVHEIHPVLFGGDPTAENNKMILDKDMHKELSRYWSSVQHKIKGGWRG